MNRRVSEVRQRGSWLRAFGSFLVIAGLALIGGAIGVSNDAVANTDAPPDVECVEPI